MCKNNYTSLIEIYAGTAMDAGIIQSMLTDAGINSFLKDEFMGTLAPWNVSGGGAGAVKIIINSMDAKEAKSIIEIYEKNM